MHCTVDALDFEKCLTLHDLCSQEIILLDEYVKKKKIKRKHAFKGYRMIASKHGKCVLTIRIHTYVTYQITLTFQGYKGTIVCYMRQISILRFCRSIVNMDPLNICFSYLFYVYLIYY